MLSTSIKGGSSNLDMWARIEGMDIKRRVGLVGVSIQISFFNRMGLGTQHPLMAEHLLLYYAEFQPKALYHRHSNSLNP